MKRWIQDISIRILDIFGAVLGIIFSIIPILIIAFLIKREDGGSVIFRQRRVGKNGSYFIMFKLRSMVEGSEDLWSRLIEHSDVDGMFKMHEDPRTTNIGKFIRKHSLDELPQFWNVLRGEMSLVGPRPALIKEVESYDERSQRRLTVKPGITGLWQVSGRSNLPFEKMIDLDLEYIQHRTWWLNIIIMVKTILLIFPSEKNGAY